MLIFFFYTFKSLWTNSGTYIAYKKILFHQNTLIFLNECQWGKMLFVARWLAASSTKWGHAKQQQPEPLCLPHSGISPVKESVCIISLISTL